MEQENMVLTRRAFIQKTTVAGAGLALATRIYAVPKALAEVGAPSKAKLVTDPNVFVRIAPDNTITVVVKHIEFGQGVFTGLTTLVAEELDADWAQMRAEGAPSNPKVYLNYAFGAQGTGGSTAIANSYDQMRIVGATMRAMLVTAAAKAWRTSSRRIKIERGVLKYGSRSATFGEMAESAMKLKPPTRVRLKKAKDFKLIGQSLPKPDTAAKLVGEATYTIDIDRPNMLTVLVAHPDRFGAQVKSFDDTEARKIDGFVAAKAIPEGVAIYAEGYWPAKKARDAVRVVWDTAGTEARSSKDLLAEYSALLDKPGETAVKRGQPEAVSATGDGRRTLQADYVFPYLAHAPMEPLDIVLERTEDGAHAWFGSQLVTGDHMTIAKTLGLDPSKVRVDVLFGGGSFGRRAQADCHLAKEGAEVLKASPDGRPVKLLWTREDDIRGGYYRPFYVHRVRATLNEKNEIEAWQQRIVGQSILAGTPFSAFMGDGPDRTTSEGATNLPYAIQNFGVDVHTTKVGVPVLWWRSVGSTHTGFSTEAFLDELLEAMGQKDQVAGRLKLLAKAPRHAGVLKAAAELAGWPKTDGNGKAYGVAVHKSFGTFVAQIAEVELTDENLPKVTKVWCAVDCGVAVNPNIIAAQMEGGIGYGLGAALYNEVELKDGGIVQQNFDDYRPLRIQDMPEIEVRVVKSDAKPTGVGEPGVPLIAPAIANAYYRLTGERVRQLPFIKPRSKTSGGVAWNQ